MPENSFAERYRNHSNSSLLKIINNPDSYEPMALDAAQKELANRNLSEDELENINKTIAEEESQKIKQKEKLIAIENTLKKKSNSFYETYIFSQQPLSATRQLNLFCVYLVGLFLYNLSNYYQILMYVILDFPKWDLSSVIVAIPFIILPIGTLLLWRKAILGWFFIIGLFTIILSGYLYASFYALFIYKPTLVPGFNFMYRPPSPLAYLLPCLLYGSGIYFLSRKTIREILHIAREKVISLIIALAALCLITILAIRFIL